MSPVLSALYIVRFAGSEDAGQGCLYVGRGVIAGIDEVGARYDGQYEERDGRMVGEVSISSRTRLLLVTGKAVEPGWTTQVHVDWPRNFSDSGRQTVIVDGAAVTVVLEKLRDLP